MKRSFIFFLLVSVFTAPLMAGSWGVRNGSIKGRVFQEGGSPIGGATVVAHRQSPPQIIRSTITRPDGSFEIPGVPVGEYLIGYAKTGFKTRDTSGGDANDQTAIGAQVRVFVEPGGLSMAPPVNLRADPSQRKATLNLSVVDAFTGDPVSGASVIVGPSSTKGGSQPGSYILEVPTNYDVENNTYLPQAVQIMADGFEAFTGSIVAVPDADMQQTFALRPILATIQGVINFDASLSPDDFENVQIMVDGVPMEVTQGRVTSNGAFSLKVPVSTRFQTRSFNIHFVMKGSTIATQSNVVSPLGGTATIGQSVNLQAKTVNVSGTAIHGNGRPAGSHHADSVVIVELGKAGTITNGSFVISDVPDGRALTLRATAVDPDTGQVETGEITFTATSDGSNGATFSLPPIILGRQ